MIVAVTDYRACACSTCRFSGRRGRVGVQSPYIVKKVAVNSNIVRPFSSKNSHQSIYRFARLATYMMNVILINIYIMTIAAGIGIDAHLGTAFYFKTLYRHIMGIRKVGPAVIGRVLLAIKDSTPHVFCLKDDPFPGCPAPVQTYDYIIAIRIGIGTVFDDDRVSGIHTIGSFLDCFEGSTDRAVAAVAACRRYIVGGRKGL